MSRTRRQAGTGLAVLALAVLSPTGLSSCGYSCTDAGGESGITVTVSVHEGTELITSETMTITPEKFYPNGEGCDPELFVASVELSP